MKPGQKVVRKRKILGGGQLLKIQNEDGTYFFCLKKRFFSREGRFIATPFWWPEQIATLRFILNNDFPELDGLELATIEKDDETSPFK